MKILAKLMVAAVVAASILLSAKTLTAQPAYGTSQMVGFAAPTQIAQGGNGFAGFGFRLGADVLWSGGTGHALLILGSLDKTNAHDVTITLQSPRGFTKQITQTIPPNSTTAVNMDSLGLAGGTYSVLIQSVDASPYIATLQQGWVI